MRLGIGEDTKVILELGSWLGKSTRFLLDAAPKATVIAVDHWKGTLQIMSDAPEQGRKFPILYDQFLSNCWEYKDRLIPVKNNTVEAMGEVYNLGIRPDLVYVDASHDYDSAIADLTEAVKLFPNAVFVGDDFSTNWKGVMCAVWETALKLRSPVMVLSHAWILCGGEDGKAPVYAAKRVLEGKK